MRKIYYNFSDNGGCGYYRATLPVRHCIEQLKPDIEIELTSTLDLNSRYDAYVFHRLVNPRIMPYLLKYKERGAKIVWELDDNLFDIPEGNPAKDTIRPEDEELLRFCLNVADRIIVSTEPLKEQLGYQDKTTVLPNLIDQDDYFHVDRSVEKSKRNQFPIKILWAGSNTHAADLELVVPALQKIAKDHPLIIQLVFYGMVPESLISLPNTTYIPPTPLSCYTRILRLIDPDIAICPLADNAFNRAKSPIKWLEMTLAGAAVVASPVGPYKDCIKDNSSGWFSEDEGNDWFMNIMGFAVEPRERYRQWAKAAGEVRMEHSWQNSPKKDLWLEFFRKVVE